MASAASRVFDALTLVLLACLAYIPLIATKPGKVAADTKQYLYLDPGRLLSQALSIWDPTSAAGQVTFQKIGYLLPQGSFYFLALHLSIATWLAQRLWMGSLLFGAGAGMLLAAKTLRLGGIGLAVACASYELSPYFLQYIGRISAILLPFAGLGFLLAFTARALRAGGWRDIALFGVVLACIGGTNATSLLYVGLGPALYVVYATFVTREVTARAGLITAAKIGLVSVAVSLWWIAALYVDGAYGISILRFTETIPAIASTSLASEVLRGLGYWYFYGAGRLGPWLGAAVLLEQPLLIAISFAVPSLAMASAALSSWSYQAFCAVLVIVGLALSVGTYPFSHPSLFGSGFKSFMTTTTIGFALRSTDRATPLVVAGLALLLGSGVTAIARRLPRFGLVLGVSCLCLIAANNVPLFSGHSVAKDFDRPEQIPRYDTAAAAYLDRAGNATRVLIIPGEDTAAYDWGDTEDSIWPGLLSRPSLSREQLIEGSYPTADLLDAFDDSLQEGYFEKATLAPIARLFSAGEILLQSDLAYWRYDIAEPQQSYLAIRGSPGVGRPVGFGKPVPNEPPASIPMLDEETLGLPSDTPWPPPVDVFSVSDPRPIDRAEPTSAPLILDGGGSGIVSAAATGLLANNPTILYAATLDGHSTLAHEAIPPGADLVVTDTNRKRYRRYSTVADNLGATLPAYPIPGPVPPGSVALPLFAHVGRDSQTTLVYRGARYVTASSYGNAITYVPASAPDEAFNDDLGTAWVTDPSTRATGSWIQIGLDHAVTERRVDLVQPLGTESNRAITKVALFFDGRRAVIAHLGAASHTPAGQVITFAPRSFRTLRIEIEGTNRDGRPLAGLSGVGFAAVRIPGVTVTTTISLPSDLLRSLGASSLSHRLTVILTREYVAPSLPDVDAETTISREFYLPTRRRFSLSGEVKLSTRVPSSVIDSLLGEPFSERGTVISASSALPGDLKTRLFLGLGQSSEPAWTTALGSANQLGAYVEVRLRHPISFDRLDLKIVADDRHSVPTAVTITTNEGAAVRVALPPIATARRPGATVSVPLHFKTVTGTTIRFTITGVRTLQTINYYTERPITLPISIASFGIPDLVLRAKPSRSALPALCRPGLIRVNGRPVDIRVLGTVGAAENLSDLQFIGCGPDATGIALNEGENTVTTTAGASSGIDIDRITLDSAPGGSAMPLEPDHLLVPAPGTIAGGGVHALAVPRVSVEQRSSTGAELAITGVHGPFWLVMGQSINAGWRATMRPLSPSHEGGARPGATTLRASGKARDRTAAIPATALGAPTLIDGYANGWYVQPAAGVSSLLINLSYAPQRLVSAALLASATSLVVLLVVVVLPDEQRRRFSRRPRAGQPQPRAGEPSSRWAGRRWASSTQVATPRRSQETGTPTLFFLQKRGRPRASVLLLAPIVLFAIAVVLIPGTLSLPIGAALGAGLGCGLYFDRGRIVLGTVTVAAIAASGVVVVVGQSLHHYPPGGGWPSHFGVASTLGLVAAISLLGLTGLDALRARPEQASGAPLELGPQRGGGSRQSTAPAPDERAGPPTGQKGGPAGGPEGQELPA